MFGLPAGNEKGKENYEKEEQDPVMIRITVFVSTCDRAALKF